jgi:hypothetical protein
MAIFVAFCDIVIRKINHKRERGFICFAQVVTKRCRLSWLTNSPLVYEPKCGDRWGVAGSQPMSAAVHRSPNKRWRSNSTFNLWFCSSTVGEGEKWSPLKSRPSIRTSLEQARLRRSQPDRSGSCHKESKLGSFSTPNLYTVP